jgi:hypothetical protein
MIKGLEESSIINSQTYVRIDYCPASAAQVDFQKPEAKPSDVAYIWR